MDFEHHCVSDFGFNSVDSINRPEFGSWQSFWHVLDAFSVYPKRDSDWLVAQKVTVAVTSIKIRITFLQS
jgi:hypothetical protein